jgi:hypothetical protein
LSALICAKRPPPSGSFMFLVPIAVKLGVTAPRLVPLWSPAIDVFRGHFLRCPFHSQL